MSRKTTRKFSPNDFKFTKNHYATMKAIPLYKNNAFECCVGWFDILFDLGHKINAYCADNGIKLPKVQQVKEKFGTLRLYYAWQEDISDEHKQVVREWVAKAEDQTEITCEYCGQPGQMMVDGGIWKVICSKHTSDDEEVYTVEEYTKLRDEQARKMRKCDICGHGYADGYFDGQKFVNRCENHKEYFITTDEYFEKKNQEK